MSAVGARVFHGLSGSEIRVAFLMEIKSQLYERLEKYWPTKLRIEFLYAMALESYPAGDRLPKASISGDVTGTGAQCADAILARIRQHYERDTDFGHNITFPKVTWKQELSLNAFALPDTVLPEPVKVAPPAALDELDLRTTSRPALTTTNAPPVATPAPAATVILAPPATADPSADRIAALERRIEELLGGKLATTERFDGKTPPRVGDLGLSTQTGDTGDKNKPPLPITGSAEVSPGAHMAESFGNGSAVAPLAIPIERMNMGIEHPPLSEGGAGGPDAIRRRTDQPLPTTTRTRDGNIVDFPLGQL